MKIRDAHAQISGDKTEYTMPSCGLDIISEDGRTLFGITLNKDGTLRVYAGNMTKFNGVLLDDRLKVSPVASNVVTIERPEYK